MRIFCSVLLLVALAACGGADAPDEADAIPDPTVENPAEEAPADGPDEALGSVHSTEGTVHSITPDRSHLRIDHDPIPDYMEAMRMPFAVEDTTLISGVEPGDRVAFTFDDSGSIAQITDLDRIEEAENE
ncbi:MAG: copper-binding protein [Longimonas sp.]|uniref:copper-binding protein n=1 Tax=Longimonas sp. TaxID=2039626 RepID=UPI003344B232